ncbi:hypothetical protein [Nesterenkonia pannonica]|nr:hypothetical protein [Nesterenkonia pannonica]
MIWDEATLADGEADEMAVSLASSESSLSAMILTPSRAAFESTDCT